MFDVAFSELLVIAVVALIVIGPERLPKVARTVGALTGRMQRYVAQVKDEVNREVRFQELQQLQQEIQQKASQAEANLQQQVAAISEDVIDQGGNEAAPTSIKDNRRFEIYEPGYDDEVESAFTSAISPEPKQAESRKTEQAATPDLFDEIPAAQSENKHQDKPQR